MKYIFNKNLNINSLRFIKLINYKKNIICIGSRVYIDNDNIKKYLLYSYIINDDLDIILNSERLLDFINIDDKYLSDLYTSLWIRDLYNDENENYYLLIDFNKNINNVSFESNNYLLTSKDFISFKLVKKYETKNILNKEFNNNLFISKIINNTESNWGKYLFEFE
jgi:hypothetical protein